MVIRRNRTKTPKNKKIKNATICTYDGIKFKSNLEKYCYQELKNNGIDFKYEGLKFKLVEPFEFKGSLFESYDKDDNIKESNINVREMSFTPDFVNEEQGWVIECKGFPSEAFPLKWKLFKQYLNNNNKNYTLYLPRKKKQIDQVISILLTKINKKMIDASFIATLKKLSFGDNIEIERINTALQQQDKHKIRIFIEDKFEELKEQSKIEKDEEKKSIILADIDAYEILYSEWMEDFEAEEEN